MTVLSAKVCDLDDQERPHFKCWIPSTPEMSIIIWFERILLRLVSPFHCIRNSTPSARQEDLACEAVRYNSVDLLR